MTNPQGFLNQFGTETNGKWALTPLRTSLLSSLAFIGKAIGCLTAGPLIEWLGHRKVFVVLCIISCIGVISEYAYAGNPPHPAPPGNADTSAISDEGPRF